MSRIIVTAKQQAEAKRLRDKGLTYAEVARLSGINSRQAAFYAVNGRPEEKKGRRYHRWTAPEKAELRRLYDEGVPVAEICARFDIHKGSVYRLLGGVKTRMTVETKNTVVTLRRNGYMPRQIREMTGLSRYQVVKLTYGLCRELKKESA